MTRHIDNKTIREWDRIIRTGGSLAWGDGSEGPYVCAVVRNVNNLGPDPSDSRGKEAYAVVQAALEDS